MHIIQRQIKAEVSTWGVEMFYIQVSFRPQRIAVECKLWCQSSYDMYVVSHQWTTPTCCLLRAVVSNGMFFTCFRFVYVASSRFPVGVTYLSHTKSQSAGPHRLMSSQDTCIGIRTYVWICGGMEHFIFLLILIFISRFSFN